MSRQACSWNVGKTKCGFTTAAPGRDFCPWHQRMFDANQTANISANAVDRFLAEIGPQPSALEQLAQAVLDGRVSFVPTNRGQSEPDARYGIIVTPMVSP